MRMTEASLYPVIPYLHVQKHNWEVTSMSDYAHSGRRSKTLAEHRTIEYRLMFGACYWRKASGQPRVRQSIFREASSAAGVWAASSFMGL